MLASYWIFYWIACGRLMDIKNLLKTIVLVHLKKQQIFYLEFQFKVNNNIRLYPWLHYNLYYMSGCVYCCQAAMWMLVMTPCWKTTTPWLTRSGMAHVHTVYVIILGSLTSPISIFDNVWQYQLVPQTSC